MSEKIDENFNIGKELYNYFYKTILTNEEKIKLKSLKIYSDFKNMNNKNNNEINIINDYNHNSINTIENNKFLEKYTVEYTGDNNAIYIAMKEEKIEDKMTIQKNKNLKLSPKVKKKINLDGLFNTEKKNNISNSPTNTISTAPSVTSNNSGNPLISVNKEKKNGDRILISCHEINLSFINKKK